MSEIRRAGTGTLHIETEDPSSKALRKDTRNEKVLKAAQMYESHFLREMVRAMRKTVPESEFNEPNMAEKMYREQMDDQYVDNWVDQGGVGLGDLIYDQIMERFSAVAPARRTSGLQILDPNQKNSSEKKPFGIPLEKPRMPIKTEDNIKMVPIESEKTEEKTLSYKLEKRSLTSNSTPVITPWSGKISAQQTLENGLSTVKVQHDNGIESSFTFAGVLKNHPLGSKVQAGEEIASLHPRISNLLWKLREPIV